MAWGRGRYGGAVLTQMGASCSPLPAGASLSSGSALEPAGGQPRGVAWWRTQLLPAPLWGLAAGLALAPGSMQALIRLGQSPSCLEKACTPCQKAAGALVSQLRSLSFPKPWGSASSHQTWHPRFCRPRWVLPCCPADPPAVSKHRLPLPAGALAIPPCQLSWLLAWCSQPCSRGREEDWLRWLLHHLLFFPKGCFVFCCFFFSTRMVGCSGQGELPFSLEAWGRAAPWHEAVGPISAGTQSCITLRSLFSGPKTTRASQNAPGTGTGASFLVPCWLLLWEMSP